MHLLLRSSVALCNLVHHGHQLPPPFQNFDSIPHVTKAEVGHYGGSVALADYCPYIQEFTWRSNNVVVRGSHCAFSENQPSECEYDLTITQIETCGDTKQAPSVSVVTGETQ